MKALARASVDLQGREMRYAELEQFENRYRLLRLGSCDFDFDITRELVHEPESSKLTSVRDALRDVLSGSVAGTIRFVLHPPAIHNFFSALPVDLPKSSRHIRAQQEAALLYGVGPSLSVDHEVTFESSGNGAPAAWQSVSVTFADVRRKLGRLAAALPGAEFEVISRHVAGGRALRRHLQLRDEEGDGMVLAVGCYPDQFDVAFGAENEWRYSSASPGKTEPDAAYFSAETLRRLGYEQEDVTQILTYGIADHRDVPSFARLYDVRPMVFDPLMLVNLDPTTIDDEFEAGAYLPCVGGAL